MRQTTAEPPLPACLFTRFVFMLGSAKARPLDILNRSRAFPCTSAARPIAGTPPRPRKGFASSSTIRKTHLDRTVVVADVLEGDTVVVNPEATPGIVACLAAVVAPEMPDKFKRNGQPLAEESRNLLATLVKEKASR